MDHASFLLLLRLPVLAGFCGWLTVIVLELRQGLNDPVH
jgi:hypothetical protein